MNTDKKLSRYCHFSVKLVYISSFLFVIVNTHSLYSLIAYKLQTFYMTNEADNVFSSALCQLLKGQAVSFI